MPLPAASGLEWGLSFLGSIPSPARPGSTQGAHEAMAEDQKNFWTTVPGILTGLAALISAAAGLVAAFHAHSSSQTTNPQPNPTVIAQPATPGGTPGAANGDAVSYTGYWSGSAENLKMAVLNLQGSGTTFSGTLQRPCVGEGLFPIDSAVMQNGTLTVTISDLNRIARTKQTAAAIIFDLKAQDGKLTGTYNQGRRHEPITFTPGKQGCPAGAKERDS